jgi:ComF family protein
MMVYNWLNTIQRLLLPPVCALCGEASDNAQDICLDCRHLLRRNRPACERCGVPLPAEVGLCGSCQSSPPLFDITRSAYVYDHPLDILIQRFKFQGELVLARLLGELLTEAIVATPAATLPQALIPVPLHQRREQQRGYNQARELAAVLAARLSVPVDAGLCSRPKATRPQSELAANLRRANLRDAFELRTDCSYRHVAIVDDVMTTGHTASALARLLKQAGVNTVEVWVLARA